MKSRGKKILNETLCNCSNGLSRFNIDQLYFEFLNTCTYNNPQRAKLNHALRQPDSSQTFHYQQPTHIQQILIEAPIKEDDR